MIRTAVFAATLLAFTPAFSSSSEAWAEHEKEVYASCLAASGLKDAKAHSKITGFDDTIGYDVLIVEGKAEGMEGHDDHAEKGEHMGHAMKICLFNRGTREVATEPMAH